MSGDLAFRDATRDDVSRVVALLADDVLGKGRERLDDMLPYMAAFDQMQAERSNCLIVAELKGEIVGCYQLTFVTGLSLGAARRALMEGVRVAASHRGHRIGERMLRDAEMRARAAGCNVMQFTTNKARSDAHRFYDRMGFTPSHIGYKKPL